MVRTCHFCHGHSEDSNEASLRRCSGCQKVFYCSKECQKYHWVEHIFDCKPNRPINTADYLALAVRQNLLPQHPQTCEDYGFNRAVTIDEKTKLFGLYIGLMKYMEIPPKIIHGWRLRGVLVDEIKAEFYKLPEGSRGDYFRWFLQNEHIVAQAGQRPSMDKLREYCDEMQLHAWRTIGGSEKDSSEQIRAAIERKSKEEQQCWALYVLLLSKLHPNPELDLWLKFGFVVCGCQEEEMELAARYIHLISVCTFREFCDAYQARLLLDLFDAKGLGLSNRTHLQDILHSPAYVNKSVWNLKQLIAQEESSEEEARMIPSVMVDYGFVNCQSDSEQRQLKRVYKAFFYTHHGDPLALHEAAIKGNIHGFLSSVVQGLRDPKFQRLMKNPYPLPIL